MARIRSLHPGQATDEDFVEMSRDARLFALHLRCEADDQGVFEWKPKRLKMAIFPADDDVDVPGLLSELVAHRQVVEFGVEGKRFGAIRNFRRWQRPKKPNAMHPLPNHLQSYVGSKDAVGATGTEPVEDEEQPVPNQFPTGSEIPPQMKEEGGRREKERAEADASDADAPPDFRKLLWVEGLASLKRQTGKTDDQCRGLVGKWVGLAADDCRLVLSKIRQAEADDVIDPVAWIAKAVKPVRRKTDDLRQDPLYATGLAF